MEKNTAPPQYSPAPTSSIPSTSVRCQTFGPNPQGVTCSSCHAQVITRVDAEASTKTHLMAVLLCLVWCCCIPYFVDSCKSRNHYCPNCGAFLGSYNN